LHLSSGNNINCTTLSGFDGDVLSKVLRGQPDIKQEKHPSKYDKSLPEIEKKMRSLPANKKKMTNMQVFFYKLLVPGIFLPLFV
jgi:hypothetical protein